MQAVCLGAAQQGPSCFPDLLSFQAWAYDTFPRACRPPIGGWQTMRVGCAFTAAPFHGVSSAWERAVYRVRGRVKTMVKKTHSHIKPDEMPAVI